MNERIRLLALQMAPVATIGHWGRVEWADNVYPQLGDKMYASIDLEKFADMIVKECGVALSPMLRDMVSRGQAYDLIKQHFGVKE